tara:strand:+ start:189 stop:557 length:369 start_codon:yes stop_codon:yes gene_type:complete
MNKAIIYLTNLTHVNNNVHSTETIPLNIGYLATFVKKVSKDQVEVKLFNLHSDLKKAVDEKKPDILGFSNYAWNSNLRGLVLQYYRMETCFYAVFISVEIFQWERLLMLQLKMPGAPKHYKM